MLRLLSILLTGVLLLTACTTELPNTTGVRLMSPLEAPAIRARHVDTVNALRAERGLGAVTLSARLTAAALTHSRDMAVQKRAWHFGSDGTSPMDRAARSGFSGRSLGENISESYDDEFALFASWLENPQTRQVMLDPRATSIGFGWYQESDGKTWWVQSFGQASGNPGS